MENIGSRILQCLPFFFFNFLLISLFLTYFFLAVLGLLCSVWASHCSGFSCCRAWDPGTWASIVGGCRFSGSSVEFSQTRDQTCVPWIDSYPLGHQESPTILKIRLI